MAVTYPEFTRYTYPYAVARLAAVGRIFNPALAAVPDEAAAEAACPAIDQFLKRISMWLNLKGLGVTPEDVLAIADNSRVLPDYMNNPRVATRDEIYAILVKSYDRE